MSEEEHSFLEPVLYGTFHYARPKSLSALYVELRNIRDFKTSAEELKL